MINYSFVDTKNNDLRKSFKWKQCISIGYIFFSIIFVRCNKTAPRNNRYVEEDKQNQKTINLLGAQLGLEKAGNWDNNPVESYYKDRLKNSGDLNIKWEMVPEDLLKEARDENNVPYQGKYNSSVINASAKCFFMLGEGLPKGYTNFLRNGVAYAEMPSLAELRELAKEISKDADLEYERRRMVLINGARLSRFVKFIRKQLKNHSAESYEYDTFEECVQAIEEDTRKGYPLVGEFCSVNPENKSELLVHAMTIIGSCQIIKGEERGSAKEFIILNTKKSIKLGKFTYNNLKKCMNREGKYRVIRFFKK